VAEPAVIVKAPAPVIKGGFASPKAVAHIMVQKFVMGVPLYRQERQFKRDQILLSRQIGVPEKPAFGFWGWRPCPTG
jgi:transposase